MFYSGVIRVIKGTDGEMEGATKNFDLQVGLNFKKSSWRRLSRSYGSLSYFP